MRAAGGIVVGILACFWASLAVGAGEIQFNREIRPLLSDNCYKCHGPDAAAREAGLRLDSAEGAAAPAKSGKIPVVPGAPELSQLVRRVFSEDPGIQMPPPESGKSLTADQKELLRRWVGEGAVREPHWAFVPPRREAPPETRNAAWARSPVDSFILARLEREGLAPSAEAGKTTLARRASLDLTGLPPTMDEVEAFLADDSPEAWGRLVDRLLDSPRYGERMAQMWLDLARYADSDGYHDDTTRAMWPYRDYVIESFNWNKPFDQFTVEQLAGDLLPGATVEQRAGSAFHRNGPTSSEGGADAMEYAARYAVDRVNTTATTWLGVTLQCAECHDHKFDPFTAREYYQMFAFFNQVPEEPLKRALHVEPLMVVATPEQERRLEELDRVAALLEAEEEDASKREAAKRARADFAESLPKLRVMADAPERRPTFILERGDYRSPGEEVGPGVPAVLGSWAPEGRADRLALARWIASRDNPLTARVFVNRLWQMLFGVGLVKTAGEFGSQGEPPSHPELLDWLAVDFMEHGWDVKRALRQILLSATYRQSSIVPAELLARDPENRLLARGARFRLPAEFVRDNALAIAGLLDRGRAPGGPSVKPYQPGDLWREFSYGDSPDKAYVRDKGPDLYRRSLYIFWKRSVLHPEMALFDAPNREVCSVGRPVTNTPLQAYVLLNDTTHVEAARVLARRVMRAEAGEEGRLRVAFLLALARPPSDWERKAMLGLLADLRAEYQGDRASAKALLAVGDAPGDPGLDPAEHAAWTGVANAILNFDETITRE